MKHKSFPGKICTGLLLLILTMACSKNASPPPNDSGQGNPPPGPKILNLVTDHWRQQGLQPVYVNTFSNIIKNQAGKMRVYLETTNNEILISPNKVGLSEGEIWCQAIGTDLQIVYRNFLQQFSAPGAMDIKLVFD